ncbi:MAG: T9SS type A sorting domain-containing protein, partial [Bacteroidales bacterium]
MRRLKFLLSAMLVIALFISGNAQQNNVKNNQKNTPLKSQGLQWVNVGPTNLGGRTRAVMVDKNNSSIVYAAGVSGGLWKSTSGGTSWSPVNNTENMFISSLIQDKDGYIYLGTGEYFASPLGDNNGGSGFRGNGIYKSTEPNGSEFQLLSATQATNVSSPFLFINQMAVNLTTNRIFAATHRGLQVSDDGGVNWYNPISGTLATQNCYDVEVANDGTVYVAMSRYIYKSLNGDNASFEQLANPWGTNVARIEIAVMPTNSSIIYAVIINNNDGNLNGAYRSIDGGANWELIGPGGSTTFYPFNQQGTYACALAVDPHDQDHILMGGIDLWEYYYGGNWEKISLYYLDETSVLYLHSHQHKIVFDPNNPDVIYIGNDGGVFKGVRDATYDIFTFTNANRKYVTSQFFTIGCNSYNQLMGGTYNNGTVLLPRQTTDSTKATKYLYGTGGYVAMSNLDKDMIIGSYPYGEMYRSNEFGGNAQTFYSSGLLANVKALGGGDMGSNTFSSYLAPILLKEGYDWNSTDSATFVNMNDTTLLVGDTIMVKSPISGLFFNYILTDSLAPGDSIKVQDYLYANLFVGLRGSVWMTRGLHDYSGAPKWYRVGTTATNNEYPQCMALSSDNNYLFVGTSGGKVYRISNLLNAKDSLSADNRSIYCVVSTDLIYNIPNRPITSISVNPEDPNKVIFTVGGYSASPTTPYVYYSTNATADSPTFINKTGNLPKYPVYASLFVKENPNIILLGTEFGIYSTDNITVSSPQWSADNEGLGNVPVYMLTQQDFYNQGSPNYGVIYAATHGRGIFANYKYRMVSIDDFVTEENHLSVYPNPATDYINIVNKMGNKPFTVSIYNMNGQLVFAKLVSEDINSTIQIPVSSLNSGTY